MEMPSGDGSTVRSNTCSTWREVEQVIDRLAQTCPDLQQDTIENAKLVVRFANGRCQTPSDIDLGYWLTVRLMWSASAPPIEIEIFGTHYEFYRFSEGTIEIKHIATTPGTLPSGLAMLLVAAIPANPR